MARSASFSIFAAAAIFIASACDLYPAAQYNTFEYHARAAKANGQRTLVVNVIEDYAFPKTLDLLLAGTSAFVIAGDRLDVARTRGDMTVQTWHTFDVVETLSMRANQGDMCAAVRSPVALGGSKVALAMTGGSVTIDDVVVTVPSGWRPVLNQRYLVFGVRCDNGVLSLPHGTADLFNVDSTGALSFAAGPVPADTGPGAVVHAVGSLMKLRARLSSSERSAKESGVLRQVG